jgi:hypothetical protein
MRSACHHDIQLLYPYDLFDRYENGEHYITEGFRKTTKPDLIAAIMARAVYRLDKHIDRAVDLY